MDKRMIITVSFGKEEKDLYLKAHNQPNSSYFIKELIKDCMIKEEKKRDTVIKEIDVEDIENLLF